MCSKTLMWLGSGTHGEKYEAENITVPVTAAMATTSRARLAGRVTGTRHSRQPVI